MLDEGGESSEVDADHYLRRACARGYRVVSDDDVTVDEDRPLARFFCEAPCTRHERHIRYVCEGATASR